MRDKNRLKLFVEYQQTKTRKNMNVPEKLPENAFKELKEGEEYEPLMSPKSS